MRAWAAQDKRVSWHFESDTLSELPKGLTNEVGKLEIIGDDTAPSKPHVLAQLAKSPGF